MPGVIDLSYRKTDRGCKSSQDLDLLKKSLHGVGLQHDGFYYFISVIGHDAVSTCKHNEMI